MGATLAQKIWNQIRSQLASACLRTTWQIKKELKNKLKSIIIWANQEEQI